MQQGEEPSTDTRQPAPASESCDSCKPDKQENNPVGLGDPDDRRLRKVEKDIMIPMKMRDKAKMEKCTDVVKAFSDCCKNSSIAMVVKCRQENTELKSCLTKWYNDDQFRQECQEEYLQERSDYRRTGIRKRDMKRYQV